MVTGPLKMCIRDSARYGQFGVASHNLFDLCYAMLLREREGVRDQVEFEMLEGMANHQARVIRQAADGLLPVSYTHLMAFKCL